MSAPHLKNSRDRTVVSVWTATTQRRASRVMGEVKDVSLRCLFKTCGLGFLVLLDIALNSSLDHDDYERLGLGSNVLFLTLGIQIVVQLTVFLTVFLMAADTYLFRVGLLGLLLSKLKPFLLCCPVYLVLTIVQGVVRIQSLRGKLLVADMWVSARFITLFVIHKAIAIPFYVLAIRAAILLCSPAMFHKAPWVKFVQAEIRKQDAQDARLQ